MIRDNPPTTLRRDVLSAYVASGAKIGSWVIVSAALFRHSGGDALGLLALVRSTLGLLNYLSLGLAPALMQMLTGRMPADEAREAIETSVVTLVAPHPLPLQYATTSTPQPAARAMSSAIAVAWLAGMTAGGVVAGYALLFDRVHHVPVQSDHLILVLAMGAGLIFRMISEPHSAALQTSGQVRVDNYILAAAEGIWVAGACLAPGLTGVALSFAGAGLFVMIARTSLTHRALATLGTAWTAIDTATVRTLIKIGSIIAAAQLADFLYAPTDFLLISWLLPYTGTAGGYTAAAYYAPAVQIDAALLVLTTGLASALLPHAMIAHAAGHTDKLRQFYIRGTLLSVALLVLAATCTFAIAPQLLTLWLGDPMNGTVAILPLLLVHTVIGGSSGVGRSILLATGHTRAFAVAALSGGVLNVIASFTLTYFFDMGLRGIVLGTVISVVARCLLWQPWYILRTLRRMQIVS